MWANHNGDKLRRGRTPQQWNVESAVIGLGIERPLHQRIRHDPNNCSPWARLRGIEDANTPSDRSFATKIFVRETGIHERDRLLLVGVFAREITAFQHLQ